MLAVGSAWSCPCRHVVVQYSPEASDHLDLSVVTNPHESPSVAAAARRKKEGPPPIDLTACIEVEISSPMVTLTLYQSTHSACHRWLWWCGRVSRCFTGVRYRVGIMTASHAGNYRLLVSNRRDPYGGIEILCDAKVCSAAVLEVRLPDSTLCVILRGESLP